MLKFLQLINYESHKNTLLEFDPGITIIVGENDQGKSGIFRAFEWLWRNRPLDSDFRPKNIDPKELTSVKLGLSEGSIITKERSDSINQYIFDKNILKGFKQKVPKDISDTINMSDINLQQQMDSLFLLSNTSGEVARYLNSITKLDDIDIAQLYVKKSKENINSILINKNNELEKLSQEYLNYENLEVIEQKIKNLENLEAKRIKLNNINRQCNELQYNIEIKNKQLIKYKQILKYKNKILKIEKLINSKGKREKIIEEYEIFSNKKIRLENLLNKSKNISKYKNNVDKLLNIIIKRKNIIIERELLKKQNNDILVLQDDIEDKRSLLKIFNKNIETYKKKYKDLIGKECPLCGSTINET